MTTAKKLFLHRLVSGWAYQYSVWKTVVDWIVALYIVIPFSALFIDTYISWWRHIPTGLNYIPLNALLVIVLLFAWSGTLRIFVEDADQIFLFQRTAWIKRLIKYSIAYYIGSCFLVTLLFCIVLAPFVLLHYGFTIHSFLWLIMSTFLIQASIGILKQLIEFRFQGWKRGLVKVILLVISGAYLQITVISLINQLTLFFLLFFYFLWF